MWLLGSLKLKELSDINIVNTSVEIPRAEFDVWRTHRHTPAILATKTRADQAKPKIWFVPGNRQLYDMDFPDQDDKTWEKFCRMLDLNIPSYRWMMGSAKNQPTSLTTLIDEAMRTTRRVTQTTTVMWR